MLLEAIASGLVAVAILWMVLQPMIAPAPPTVPIIDPPEPEETARGRALLALKEIEFDRATAKLSDEDYEMLRDRYERAAIATMEGCAKCGAPLSDTDKFCTKCGTRR
jgi:hypothetical protein